MPANIDNKKMLRQKEINESIDVDYSFIGLADQSDSEIKWVKLHQMFDK
tara:strand:+ start:574 stop:720 length:147 start_codon:yes stop_codon:yes gene_type:complete